LLAGALTVLEDAVSALREQLERSEIGRETALAKVDDLRVQITELGTELAVAKLFSEQAEAKAQEAAQAAEALRAADDARQAQGRWARLRAAWRGR
jgi:hypothetical protein